MAFSPDQFSFDMWWDFSLSVDRVEYRNFIIDRKSKYTVVAFKISEITDIKSKFKNLISDSYFRKASHNSYAYRIVQDNGSIIEWKNDDWEQWAGMCILRELQRENAVWVMLIVTRYFWGIQLHNDRFKNVIDACKLFFEKQRN